jgi:purine-nucleoside phosphorylase
MERMLEKLKETVAFIQEKTEFKPQYGIVLGTGLGKLADEIEVELELNYADIPNFPVSTVWGHSGKMIFGMLEGKKVVAMAGRFHYYEGYTMKEVTFPIRVMRMLGIELLCLSNAAGSLNPDIKTGDLMIIRDHINLQPEHPLRGKNDDELGPRFPDLLHSYDKDLVDQGLEIARKNKIRCQQGVYVGVQGPSLETPAEYKYMHIIGGDAVGMSTVPEVIVARHMDLKVFAISVATDMGYPPEVIQVTTHEEVVKVANETAPKVTAIIRELIASQ